MPFHCLAGPLARPAGEGGGFSGRLAAAQPDRCGMRDDRDRRHRSTSCRRPMIAAMHHQHGSEEGKAMVSPRSPTLYRLLRPIGAALLGVAFLIASYLFRIGPAHPGHEPFGVYVLS